MSINTKRNALRELRACIERLEGSESGSVFNRVAGAIDQYICDHENDQSGRSKMEADYQSFNMLGHLSRIFRKLDLADD